MDGPIVLAQAAKGGADPLVRAFRKVVTPPSRLTVVESKAGLRAALDGSPAPDAIVVDLDRGMGGDSGETIIQLVRALSGTVPLVAVVATAGVEVAEHIVSLGATDLLVRGDKLEARIRTLLGKLGPVTRLSDVARELRQRDEQNARESEARHRILGQSEEIREVLRTVERVAKIPRPVLIVGERGTGKELIARAIHAAYSAESPFVALNCAAVPDSLLDSELFGHERGAFTGATAQVRGKFAQAERGTLFLDEIGNMSLAFQKKLLRVIEYGTFVRVGGHEEIPSRCRLISATNAVLAERMERGEFLPDLYDRLSFEVISVPPLRARGDDRERLAEHFLSAFMLEVPALKGKRLGESARAALWHYDFPGNVRELKNVIERAAYRDVTNELTVEDLAPWPPLGGAGASSTGTFEEQVASFKRALLREALLLSDGNATRAAERLGLAAHQFRYYRQRYLDS